MKKIIISVLVIVFVILFSIPAIFFYTIRAQGTENNIVFFEIEQGDTIASISKKLIDENLIQAGSSRVFSLLARYLGYDRQLKTGFYEINGSMNMIDILHTFNKGKQILEKFVVVEGKNIYEIADMFDERGLVTRLDFLTAASNETILREYDIPTDTVEGYLFPSTYYIAKGHKAESYVRLMM